MLWREFFTQPWLWFYCNLSIIFYTIVKWAGHRNLIREERELMKVWSTIDRDAIGNTFTITASEFSSVRITEEISLSLTSGCIKFREGEEVKDALLFRTEEESEGDNGRDAEEIRRE